MSYSISSLDTLGDGYGFRKVRAAARRDRIRRQRARLPARLRRAEPLPRHQDELYFVHRGTATFSFDGDEHEVAEGGIVHVESTTHRMISNRTGDDLVLFVVGGKGGYVERDGQVVSPEDLAKRSRDEGDAAVNGLMMDYQLTLPDPAPAR